MNTAVTGALITGILGLLVAIASPFVASWVSKDSQKAADAVSKATEAEKLGTTAINMYDRVEKRLEKTEEKLEATETRCNRCLTDLSSARLEIAALRKANNKLGHSHAALLDAVVEVVPLLEADDDRTRTLRAAIRTARQARYDYSSD